ncbi:helix-turn-helix domain-containing protein [Streptomyces turgidiscabies]
MAHSESVTTDQAREPLWNRELNYLPVPYPWRTYLAGDAVVQFTRRVVNAYGLGASIRDIAGVTNRSFGAVRRVLLNSGVKLRGRGRAHNGIRPPLT